MRSNYFSQWSKIARNEPSRRAKNSICYKWLAFLCIFCFHWNKKQIKQHSFGGIAKRQKKITTCRNTFPLRIHYDKLQQIFAHLLYVCSVWCVVCGVSKKELLQHLKNALNANHSPELQKKIVLQPSNQSPVFPPIFLLFLFFMHLTKIAFGDFYWICAWTQYKIHNSQKISTAIAIASCLLQWATARRSY